MTSVDLMPSVEPDRIHAQLLIQTSPISPELERVQRMINAWGVEVIELKPVAAEWTLLKLSVGDMREVVFKLTRCCAFKIKGINASP